MKPHLHLLILAALTASAAAAVTPQGAQQAVDRFTADSTLRHASAGVAIVDLSNGNIIAGHHQDLATITASTMKTVTSAAALQVLGPDYRFTTPVYLDGEVMGSRLKGNVVVVGSGDPTLGSRYFKEDLDITREVVAALHAHGITRVDGNVVVDNTLYPYAPYCDDWDAGDLAWDFGMGVQAVNYCDNAVRFVFEGHDGTIANARLTPEVSGVRIINKLWHGKRDNVNLHLEYATPAVVVSGTVADTTYYFNISNPTPDVLLRDSLWTSLSQAGIVVHGKTLDTGTQRWLLLEHRSPRLSDIIQSLLERSDNMFTEALLRTLAHHTGLTANDANGVQVVNRTLRRLGIDVSAKFQRDGSGLARANKASPAFFAQLLTVMNRQRYGQNNTLRLVDLMPRVGVNARIGSKLSDSKLSGKIAVKSGSMSDVQCYVGYYPAGDPQWGFVTLINNWHGSRASLKDRIDTLLLDVFGGK